MDFRSQAGKIEALFRRNFEEFGEVGASVSIWHEGQEVVSLAGGFEDRQKTTAWTRETAVLFWSATKALAAGTLLAVLKQERVELDRNVAAIWPEFGAAGKRDITLTQLMSHQAGLPGLVDRSISVFDHEAVCSALAQQTPLWEPGTRHGYHTRTFGFLLDELVRRMTGKTLGQMWRELFAEPMDLEIFIGLSVDSAMSVAPVFPARNSGGLPDTLFWRAMADRDSLTNLAFSTPAGLASVASMNTAEARQVSLPAIGGIGTAHALGKWYAMLAQGGEWDGRRYFSDSSLREMSEIVSQGDDVVTLEHTAFSCGFMLDPILANRLKLHSVFGPSLRAFGHPGAGGSHAFADPENGISFAYVMNQMELGIFPNAKSLRLVNALYS